MRRTEPAQLSFAFAVRLPRRDNDSTTQVAGKGFLQETAKNRKASGSVAKAGSGSCDHSLLKEIASPPNLAEALLSVARNKGAAGVDGRGVGEVVEAAPRLLPRLRRALLGGTYQPGDIRRVWIPKPGGGKRGLGIPNVVDRWVQQAVLQVLEPVFDPRFHSSSHGFRKGRGVHTAIAEAKEHLAEGHRYVVDIDLSKFFDRVNHQRLLARLGKRVSDGKLMKLIRRMLKANVVLPDGIRIPVEEGVPQGGPLSPLLSNIVLDEFDQELERRGHRFCRYADDCQIYVRSIRAGRRVMASITRFLETRMRLQINQDKSAVRRPGQATFLGFRLGFNRAGKVTVHVSKRTYDRLNTRIRELTPRSWGQSLAACFEGLNHYVRGFMAHFQMCTKEGARVFDRFDAHIRRRVRAIIIRQKKRSRHLFRYLWKKLGVPRGIAAHAAFSSRGPWYKSNLPGITRGYGTAWFAKRLASLRSEWTRLDLRTWEVSRQTQLFAL